jgi:hypothetical protein
LRLQELIWVEAARIKEECFMAGATITFPGLDGPAANERARELLAELEGDADLKPYLEAEGTGVKRDDQSKQDFGVTLVAVFGAPAVVILAQAVKSWCDRTGVRVKVNDIEIANVRGKDAAAIVKAIEGKSKK